MESELFTLSLRIGSINEEFSVPANDGKRYTQLSNEVSLIQLRHQPDVKSVEMLPLLSSDLFGGVTPDETASAFNLSVLKPMFILSHFLLNVMKRAARGYR